MVNPSRSITKQPLVEYFQEYLTTGHKFITFPKGRPSYPVHLAILSARSAHFLLVKLKRQAFEMRLSYRRLGALTPSYGTECGLA
jgi:hypothetical protein